MKILVTGGAGFIGSNFIHKLFIERPDWLITNFDNLTYAGNLQTLEDIVDKPDYRFIKGDIADSDQVLKLFKDKFDFVVNFAAESHVDRSLYDPGLFIKTNTLGTQNLLTQAYSTGVKRFVQISTDEVYGSLGDDGLFDENCQLKPNSPYAASKASADLLCRAYYKTHGMPVMITRAGNNYGPFQFPEKLIPFFILRALKDKRLPLYGDGLNVRDWLYVDDHCDGILTVLEKGEIGRVYNIGASNEMTNIEITGNILKHLAKPDDLIEFVKDRPGHDRRYALDYSRINSELQWQPKMDFSEGIKKTIDWYCNNRAWLDNIISGDYQNFYDKHYGERL